MPGKKKRNCFVYSPPKNKIAAAKKLMLRKHSSSNRTLLSVQKRPTIYSRGKGKDLLYPIKSESARIKKNMFPRQNIKTTTGVGGGYN